MRNGKAPAVSISSHAFLLHPRKTNSKTQRKAKEQTNKQTKNPGLNRLPIMTRQLEKKVALGDGIRLGRWNLPWEMESVAEYKGHVYAPEQPVGNAEM